MQNLRSEVKALPASAAVRCLLLLSMVFCTTGATCTRTIRSPFAPWAPPAPEVLAAGSSLDQVIAAVNQNSAKITSMSDNEVPSPMKFMNSGSILSKFTIF